MAQAARDRATRIAVIGGSGLYQLDHSAPAGTFPIQTPYAAEAVELSLEQTAAGAAWFLPRHGRDHSVAPHRINYRANLWALHQAGVDIVIAVNAVGGIADSMIPGALVLPEQLIDYTWGREHTFATGAHALDKHVDFTWPYDRDLARTFDAAAAMLDLPVHRGAVYGCTQGPRLETAAEIRRMQRDGCDIVGMTGMPEAGLARELGMRYACIALVVNRAAGLGGGAITHDDVAKHLREGMGRVRALLMAALPQLIGGSD
ncbi:MAG TPA: S-methyl-5'-thioinosine phosphorylase [Pseudomonadales bacterium]